MNVFLSSCLKNGYQIHTNRPTAWFKAELSHLLFCFLRLYKLLLLEQFPLLFPLKRSNSICVWVPPPSVACSYSLPDPEPVHASGRRELWEAEDGVGATGAAHQEVSQLVAVADAHPGLLQLHQHDPLHQNLPPTAMMPVRNPELLAPRPPVFTEK